MKDQVSCKPKSRSRLRLQLGSFLFTLKRYWDWRCSGRSFACRYDPDQERYPHRCFVHQTPLLRQLANTELWMQQNKVVNLKLAVARLDGLVLSPGEVFSFWRLVGRPTRRRGFRDGMVLCEGRVVPGLGGGLCQPSNLIYWLTLHTELTVTERWRHNYDVFPDAGRTQPFGSGATVSYNYVDLQIKNETGNTCQLHLWLTETDLCGEWRSIRPPTYSFEVYEQEHLITHEPWGGYVRRNLIRRRLRNTRGEQVGDEPVAENHAIMMYEPFLPPGMDERHVPTGLQRQ